MIRKDWLVEDVEYINHTLMVISQFEEKAVRRSLEANMPMFTTLQEIIALMKEDISIQIKQMEVDYGIETIQKLLKRGLGKNILKRRGTTASNNIFAIVKQEDLGDSGKQDDSDRRQNINGENRLCYAIND